MIDQEAIANLIQQQINEAVRHQVTVLLEDPLWVDHIEQRAIKMLQARIESRFANIQQDPVLNQSIHSGLKSILDRGIIPEISQYVDSEKFEKGINDGLYRAISDVIANLSLDSSWLSNIENQINQQMHAKVNRHMAQLDLSRLISTNIDSALVNYFNDHDLVRTPGIDDRAANVELTVLDGVVVVEKELATTDLTVHGSSKIAGLEVDDLVITQRLDASTPALEQLTNQVSDTTLSRMEGHWKTELVNQVTNTIRDRGLDIKNATVNGNPLIVDDELSPGIKHSSLTRVGDLETLTVIGPTTISDQLSVSKLSVGHDDTGLIIEPADKSVAVKILDGRKLVFDINGHIGIEISPDRTVKIDQLQIKNNRISFAGIVPGYSGTRGDIVFNTEPAAGKAFAWVCLGGFNWQSVKSS